MDELKISEAKPAASTKCNQELWRSSIRTYDKAIIIYFGSN